MLLFEAHKEIEDFLNFEGAERLRVAIPEVFEALEIAKKSIEAQERLSELLNDLALDIDSEIHENDKFSIILVYEMLSRMRFDAKFDEDGMCIWDDAE